MGAKLISQACVLAFVLYSQVASAGVNPDEFKDQNPDQNVVEVNIVAKETEVRLSKDGKKTKMWTYNGMKPGSTIRAKVGDRLVVHLYNQLSEPTTIHWHGVETPANMDGSSISQEPVLPGQYFRYEFDLNVAALFWFHPHFNTPQQIERGLYGTLLVEDPDDLKTLNIDKDFDALDEHILVLDDILLDSHDQIDFRPITEPMARALRTVNGREGNTLLVNGQVQPKLELKRGRPVRLRLVNVSNSRFMRVSIPGHRLWKVGGDGGLLEKPQSILPIAKIQDPNEPDEKIYDPNPHRGLLLTPGERADVVFTPRSDVGSETALVLYEYTRGKHEAYYRPDGFIGFRDREDEQTGKKAWNLMKIRLKGDKKNYEYQPPEVLRTIPMIDAEDAPVIPVTLGHMNADKDGNVMFFAQKYQGRGIPFAKLTAELAPKVKAGDVRMIEVTNMTGGDHNFHLHGFSFQHIETEFVDMDNMMNNRVVKPDYREVKDTILVPRRPAEVMMRSKTIVRLAVWFDDNGREGQIQASGKVPSENSSGGWLYHCHLLEHAEKGMMGFLQVVE